MGDEQRKDDGSQTKSKLDQFKKKDINPAEFGYLAVPDIDLEWPRKETQRERIWRKCKENPFVPFGE